MTVAKRLPFVPLATNDSSTTTQLAGISSSAAIPFSIPTLTCASSTKLAPVTPSGSATLSDRLPDSVAVVVVVVVVVVMVVVVLVEVVDVLVVVVLVVFVLVVLVLVVVVAVVVVNVPIERLGLI